MADQRRPIEIDNELLTRFLAGEATDAERAEIRRWSEENPENNIELSVFRRLWDESGALPSPERINSMWQTLQRKMHEPDDGDDGDHGTGESGDGARPLPLRLVEETPAAPPEPPTPPPSMAAPRRIDRARSGLRRFAPVVGLVIVLSVVWFARGSWGGEPQMELTRDVATERGERIHLRLADGTRMEIGPESTLRIRYVAGGAREVELVGEAIFDVPQGESRPFRVRAGDAITENVGTRFGVRAYPTDGGVRVVVDHGKVSLRSSAASRESTHLIHTGQLGRLDSAGTIVIDSAVDASAYLGWARDRLAYDAAPLQQIAADLERWYDVEVELTRDDLPGRTLTVDVDARRLDDVLNAIAGPLQLQHLRQGDTIFFHP
jgi:transmembrane sensor